MSLHTTRPRSHLLSCSNCSITGVGCASVTAKNIGNFSIFGSQGEITINVSSWLCKVKCSCNNTWFGCYPCSWRCPITGTNIRKIRKRVEPELAAHAETNDHKSKLGIMPNDTSDQIASNERNELDTSRQWCRYGRWGLGSCRVQAVLAR